MDPLVSIVVITYNSSKFVIETLDSAKNQTYQNIELIVTDDCSTDNTVEICEKWMKENKERFVRTKVVTVDKNGGIPANLNRGIKEAKGEWVKGTAGDDLFVPTAIETFISEVRKDTANSCKMYHARMETFHDNVKTESTFGSYGKGSKQKFNLPETTAEEQNRILLRFCPVIAPTTFFKREIFEKISYFDERFKFWEDRPMWLKLTSNGIKIHFIDKVVVKYRQHAESVQSNKNKTLLSRTQISMNDAYKELIVPHLTKSERRHYNFIIKIKNLFLKLTKNKKTLFMNSLYKILILYSERRIAKIKQQYAP